MDDPKFIAGLAQYLIPAAISLVVAIITAVVTVWQKTASLRHEFELQRERLRTELKLEFSIETAIRELLLDPRFKERQRTFEAIKKRLDIFEDDRELRKHLVRAGAIRFVRKEDGAELWGLRELVDKADLWERDPEDNQVRPPRS